MERVTQDELELIARQIGRAPRGNLHIARRCPHGYPQVLSVPPWVEGAPFPTLYWLSCPFLVRAVAALEAKGWVARLEEQVARDRTLRAALDRAHAECVTERLQRIHRTQGLTAQEREQLKRIENRGIGGIADWSRLKCLHVHVAHALVHENPVGDLVLARLNRIACGQEKVICSSLEEGGADRGSTDRKPEARA